MKGSIIKRSGGYTLIYTIRIWDEKKQAYIPKQKWEKVPWKKTKSKVDSHDKWVPPSKKDAETLLAKRMVELNAGDYIEPTDMTFAQFKDEWMEKYAEAGEIRHSTLTLYRGFFRTHMIPYFGTKPLATISTKDIQGFKARMLTKGKKRVKWVEGADSKKKKEVTLTGLSAQTVKHMLRIMRQMFDHAIDWNYLRINPAKKVPMPKIKKKEMDCLTPDEAALFLQHLPQKWYPFFMTAIVTGMRVGELIGMRWENMDWDKEQYFVKETWLRPRAGRKAEFAEPKTESSMAPVELTRTCLNALKQHRKAQAAEKLKAGENYQDQGLIFATSMGKPLDDKHIIQRTFHPTLMAAGIRTIRFHDLRHTCASILINRGVNQKRVQKQLRHSSIEITLDRYAHLFPDGDGEVSKHMDEALSFPVRASSNGAV